MVWSLSSHACIVTEPASVVKLVFSLWSGNWASIAPLTSGRCIDVCIVRTLSRRQNKDVSLSPVAGTAAATIQASQGSTVSSSLLFGAETDVVWSEGG